MSAQTQRRGSAAVSASDWISGQRRRAQVSLQALKNTAGNVPDRRSSACSGPGTRAAAQATRMARESGSSFTHPGQGQLRPRLRSLQAMEDVEATR